MNPQIREAIMRAFEGRILWMDYQLPEAIKRQSGLNETDIVRTMHLMKDAGELVLEGSNGALRLSLKAVQAQAPKKERWKQYMIANWIILLGLLIAFLGIIIDFFKR